MELFSLETLKRLFRSSGVFRFQKTVDIQDKKIIIIKTQMVHVEFLKFQTDQMNKRRE